MTRWGDPREAPDEFVRLVLACLPPWRPNALGESPEVYRANQLRTAKAVADQIWRVGFAAGAAYAPAGSAGLRWMVVTPEERDRLVASMRDEEEEGKCPQ